MIGPTPSAHALTSVATPFEYAVVTREVAAMKPILLRIGAQDAFEIITGIQAACHNCAMTDQLRTARQLAVELQKSFGGEAARLLVSGWNK